ncbi:FAD binding domain protein [Rhodococcus sp. MTM3W5.2]|uniref:FAD-dependent oxidoreductase n=1 Tax=Rhodococcus sp. MTM3W5.2 TaxID=1805827 RepID=UPI0009791221|nr:FAD-dependent monooxygenase [Rhodococcus sp. MTM3W5.2]AQA26047.1 FAD binding domain protein [Rhodococcus sp. MTM3W5.2]
MNHHTVLGRRVARAAAGTETAARRDTHAVVIGGSIAGLLASRVLSDHFGTVTIFEKDHLADNAEPRTGVPQGRHVHSIWKRGLTLMEESFPGLTAELVAGGSAEVEMTTDFAWYHRGVWKLRVPSGIRITCQTRPFLEWHIRMRVCQISNIRLVDQCHVKRFAADAGRITGVVVQSHRAGAAEETVAADLVVDASGRGSGTPRWLEELGYERPAMSVIDVDVGYATRFYDRPPLEDHPWKALIIAPTPPHGKRLGVVFPVEDQRWIVMLGGWNGDHPPRDDDGLLEFARSLEAPDIYTFMRDGVPLTPSVGYRFRANTRRYYERMQRFPGGLIVLGDSLCSFNPIYGQGMTTSALDAMTLRECLERGVRKGDSLDAIANRFRKRVPRRLEAPWRMAAGEDMNWPGTHGDPPFGTAFMNWYLGRVHALAARDPRVLVQFVRVANMIDSPARIFHPRVLAPVLTRSARVDRLRLMRQKVPASITKR